MIEPDLAERLRLGVHQALLQADAPGATVAIRRHGQMVLEAGVGDRDLHREHPLPADAHFYIYSITKSLIATALLSLVGRGWLDLDAPVQAYLTELPLDTAVTVRQLLSHTSGLPDYGGLPAYGEAVKAEPGTPWSTATFLALLQTQGLQFPPGQGWGYSNLGYLVLKRLLEARMGLSLQDSLQHIIFHPLALQQTFVPTTLADVTPLTPGCTTSLDGNTPQDMSQLYHPGWVAHGVVVSTAAELACMVEALFLGTLLDRTLAAQMTCPVYNLGQYPPFTQLGYGLGVFVDPASPYGAIAGHMGEGPGYSVAAFHFPNLLGSATTITALVNRDRPALGLALVFQIADMIAASAR